MKDNTGYIKEPRPYEPSIVSISLDTTGFTNEEVVAVLYYKENNNHPDHHHIMLNRSEAYKLFVWLENNLDSLTQEK